MSALVALLILAAAVAVLWLAVRTMKSRWAAAANDMLLLVQQGAVTSATITAIDRRRMSRGQYDYFLIYTFRDRSGEQHEKEQRMSTADVKRYSEGQSLDIVYVPGNPTICATAESVDRVRNTAAG